jgi:hypothetical protein
MVVSNNWALAISNTVSGKISLSVLLWAKTKFMDSVLSAFDVPVDMFV